MNPGISIIVDRINKHIHPGDTILCMPAIPPNKPAQALPTIIENIHSQGYEILTVSELLAEAAANP